MTKAVRCSTCSCSIYCRARGSCPSRPSGMRFDPYRHEALFQVKTEELEEGTVAEEIQKGYLFNNHVIRFSKVAVAKR